MIKFVSSFLSLIYDRFLNFGTAKSLVLGFLTVILMGTVLLMLPIASKDGMSLGFVDSFFTATSAVCVTGLVVVNTAAHFTIFGKVVILVLIQIGGLSFMTLVTAFIILFGKRITLRDRLLIKESLNQHTTSGMVKLVKNIIRGTFIIEGIGALVLFLFFFVNGEGFIDSIGMGIFISISAFCNAGFDVIGDSSLMPYVGSDILNITVMLLIIIGGIGFAVWVDAVDFVRGLLSGINPKVCIKRLSLHTKIVLTITSVLLVSGFLVTFVLEFFNPDTLGGLGFSDKVLASWFQSVTLRTAGFNTLDLNLLNEPTKIFYLLQMFIGGSPGGTAGGVKTVTIGVIFFGIISAVKGRDELVAFNRTIHLNTLLKSLAVLTLNMSAIVVAVMVLSSTMSNLPDTITFLDLLFESVSAVGTVGLTLSVTPYLTVIGKLTIAICMFLGRLGPLTIAIAFTKKANNTNFNVKYPHEKIIVG